jgi:hypothetical protein
MFANIENFFLRKVNVKNLTSGPFKSGVYLALFIFLLGSIISMQVMIFREAFYGQIYLATYKQTM